MLIIKVSAVNDSRTLSASDLTDVWKWTQGVETQLSFSDKVYGFIAVYPGIEPATVTDIQYQLRTISRVYSPT